MDERRKGALVIETQNPRTGAFSTVHRGTSMLPGSIVCLGVFLFLFAGCSGSADPRPTEVAFEPPRKEVEATGQDLFARAQDPGDKDVKAVADEVNLAAQTNRATALWLVEQANTHFAEANYAAAERAYRRALDADPTLQEAKEKLSRCLMFLGRRDGEIRTVLQQFGEEVRVLEEQRLSEATRFLSDGKAALESGSIDEALSFLQRARERLIWFDYGVDVTDLQAEAQSS